MTFHHMTRAHHTMVFRQLFTKRILCDYQPLPKLSWERRNQHPKFPNPPPELQNVKQLTRRKHLNTLLLLSKLPNFSRFGHFFTHGYIRGIRDILQLCPPPPTNLEKPILQIPIPQTQTIWTTRSPFEWHNCGDFWHN